MTVYNEDYTVTIASVNASPGTPPVFVQAPMPESFAYDASVMYEAPFAQGHSGNFVVNALKVTTGLKLVTHAMTAQIWQGSSSTELGLELEFQAEYDPIKEVRDPILSLIRLATASVSPTTGQLASPGPKFDWEKIVSTLSSSELAQITLGVDTDNIRGEHRPSTLVDPSRTTTHGTGDTNRVGSDEPTLVDKIKAHITDKITIKIGRFAYFDSVVINSVQKTYESQFEEFTGLPMYAKVAIRFTPLFMIVQEDLDRIFGVTRANNLNPIQGGLL